MNSESLPLLRLCPDALLHFHCQAWVLSNPRRRVHVRLDLPALAAVQTLADGAPADVWKTALSGASGFERTLPVGEGGLWEDPTLLSPKDLECASGVFLFDLLRSHLLLTYPEEYSASHKPLDSILDNFHTGTFHQKVGQSLLRRGERGRSWNLWQLQKFTEDGKRLRHSPYAHVQGAFFETYFTSERCHGRRILDFACGNGYYAGLFASRGAQVTGIDTDHKLLDVARRNHGASASFVHAGDPATCMDWLVAQPAESFDLIYMSDIFLLLMCPEHGKLESDPSSCMAALRRLLAPHGQLIMMEPNGSFWLAGRYGNPECPLAIIPEYRRPVYHVAPTLDQTLAVTSRAGLALIELHHPEATRELDAQDAHYAAEFPMWDFLVFEPRPRPCDTLSAY